MCVLVGYQKGFVREDQYSLIERQSICLSKLYPGTGPFSLVTWDESRGYES